jgi:N-acetylmuramoyl-L-alanine amidase
VFLRGSLAGTTGGDGRLYAVPRHPEPAAGQPSTPAHRGRGWLAGALALVAVGCAGCGTPASGASATSLAAEVPGRPHAASVPAPAPSAPVATTPSEQPTTRTPRPKLAPVPRKPAGPGAPGSPVSRRQRVPVVVLDPGHNGGNSDHPGQVDAEVPAGYGETKACNTTGTASADGYAEHAFTFDVAVRAQRILAAHRVSAVLTRSDDHGVGPCVNQRATFGNARQAAAVVAIHADGHSGGRGFHVIEAARPPAGLLAAVASHRLAVAVHDTYAVRSGFGPANYIGTGGYAKRSDLAGLNLSVRPTIFIECGNMRDAADAGRMASAAGRQRIAQAIADGILRYLHG